MFKFYIANNKQFQYVDARFDFTGSIANVRQNNIINKYMHELKLLQFIM